MTIECYPFIEHTMIQSLQSCTLDLLIFSTINTVYSTIFCLRFPFVFFYLKLNTFPKIYLVLQNHPGFLPILFLLLF